MGPHVAVERDAMGHRLPTTDAAFIAVAFLGGFSFWPALIALGSLFETLAGGEELK